MNEKLRALYKGALQGSTMGLADEAIGGIGALYARAMAPELFQGDSFSNTYSQARDLDRVENKQLEQNNPWTYGGANLVGSVAMPVGMAGQGLKGAVKAGGIAGGLTGYGMSEKTNPYALALDTATGAGLGAGAGAALYGAGKVATNPQVQKFAKDYIADESGALKIPMLTDNYYKNIVTRSEKLDDFLTQNNIEYNVEQAKTGSLYYTIYKPDGGQITARLADHANQAAGTSKNSHNYQIYPEDGGMGGGGSVEGLINDLSEKYGFSYSPPKKALKPQITKDDLINRYGHTKLGEPKSEQAALKRINEDLKYSDGLFKDMYKMDKQTIKKIMGIE